MQQQLVQSAMPQNKFPLILKNIDLCDNGNLDPGVTSHEYDTREVQKFFHNDKKCQCQWVIDCLLWEVWRKTETMLPLKPIRSGYKVWCLNLQGGYLYNFEEYQGDGSKNEYADDFNQKGVIKVIKSKRVV